MPNSDRKNILLNNYKISPVIIDLLLKHNVIMPLDQIWKQGYFHTLDIEINTHCNYRCIYCPEKYTPKEPRFMSNELFSDIIAKAQRYPTITTIALNSFNEPLLDPDFLNKMEIVSKTKLKVNLFTNGSLLDPDKLDDILKMHVLKAIHFNIPSLDERCYHQKTGSKLFERAIHNIDYAIRKDANIVLVVISKGKERAKFLKEFKDRYGRFSNVTITPSFANDRAGLLKSDFNQNIQIDETLSGCIRFMDFLIVSVDGDFFICCQDFHQKEKYGNIRDGEISDIVTSEKAIYLRKKIFGAIESNTNFICRNCYEMSISQTKVNINKALLKEALSKIQ